MRKKLPFALVAAFFLQMPLSARATNTATNEDMGTVKQQILLQEEKYNAGILHGDLKLLDSVFADTFVDTNSRGKIRDKQAMLAILAKETPPSSITERNRIISVYGAVAVVTVEFAAKGIDGGKHYRYRGRATDVWALQNGTWRCVAAHSSEIK
jgi:ketosteroid isomerase-like protein